MNKQVGTWKFMPVTKPLCSLMIPVLTIPGWTALIVTLAFLSWHCFTEIHEICSVVGMFRNIYHQISSIDEALIFLVVINCLLSHLKLFCQFFCMENVGQLWLRIGSCSIVTATVKYNADFLFNTEISFGWSINFCDIFILLLTFWD